MDLSYSPLRKKTTAREVCGGEGKSTDERGLMDLIIADVLLARVTSCSVVVVCAAYYTRISSTAEVLIAQN